MNRVLLPSLVFVVIVPAGLLGGCSSAKGDAAFLNEGIAASYAEFYAKGPSQPVQAEKALEKAIAADSGNAYSVYLKASHKAKQGDLEEALALMKTAEQMPKMVHYVASLPPDDPMQTLNRIRQFGFQSRSLDKLPGEGMEFYDSLKTMGERVAAAEPVTSLGVICGSSVIRTSLSTKAARLAKEKKADEAAKVLAELKRFEDWSDALTKNLSEANRDIIREAGQAAGLTESELADFARGIPLKDSGKQKKADSTRLKLYDAEVAVLRSALKNLPDKRFFGPDDKPGQ